MSAPKRLLSFVVLLMAQFAIAQNVPAVSPAVEQRIRHVENGLIGGIVIKGKAHERRPRRCKHYRNIRGENCSGFFYALVTSR